jgi:hypothetical protein
VTFTATQYAVYEDTSPAPDGDGLFNAATDSLIMQKSLMQNFPIARSPNPGQWSNASPTSPLQFNAKGLLDTSVTTTGTVRVTVEKNGEYDCIAILETRNALGKWDGTQCKAK